jgi:hypothetical protein
MMSSMLAALQAEYPDVTVEIPGWAVEEWGEEEARLYFETQGMISPPRKKAAAAAMTTSASDGATGATGDAAGAPAGTGGSDGSGRALRQPSVAVRRNAPFGAPFLCYKRSFYQDRLGTDIGKVGGERKRKVFCAGDEGEDRVHARSEQRSTGGARALQAEQGRALAHRQEEGATQHNTTVSCFFCCIVLEFLARKQQRSFAKTGSGQNIS